MCASFGACCSHLPVLWGSQGPAAALPFSSAQEKVEEFGFMLSTVLDGARFLSFFFSVPL